MSTSGSGIDFLVGYAESEGALAEVMPEGAVLVLPAEMRSALNLPEELRLTEDPETAREDGFLLVASGHPVLMAAARTVLTRGDVGCSSLPHPTGLPPTPRALQDKAREQIYADHGRIDVIDTPEATSLVVLRVGALLTYSISIDERVQELEEMWVAADSGHPISEELCERLRSAALDPDVRAGIVVPTGESVARAHDLLCARAQRRVDELARQTAARLSGQLGVVDDYYGRVLSSIDERLGRAGSDRVAMLTEQAEATRREWTRRRSEVTDDLVPSFEIQPFRLHLVAVPSYSVRAVVRRGARAYSVPLIYVAALSSFVQPRCPSCGSEAILVAGKDQLGCRTCLIPRTVSDRIASTDQVADVEPIASAPTRLEDVRPDPCPDSRAMANSVPSVRRPSSSPARSNPKLRTSSTRATSTRKRSAGRVTPKGSADRSRKMQAGMRVAMSFWSSVRSGELRSRDTVPNSPMRALLRLYGSLGPAFVIGVEDAGKMTAVSTSPVSEDPDGVCSTAGDLQRSGEEDSPFVLYWRSGSRSNLIEVGGFPLETLGPLLARRDELGTVYRSRYGRYLVPPPEPIIELDPTAEVLLDQAARFAGLGYASWCMAAWWYVSEEADPGGPSVDHLDPSVAAAVESVVSKRFGMKIKAAALAERYDCPGDDVRRHVKSLQSAVHKCTDLPWD